MNHRLFKLILLLAFWAGMELSMTFAHAEISQPKPPKPIVEYSWPVLRYADHFYHMRNLLGVSYQTTDCNHDNESIEYFDNLRTLPGYVIQLEGVEVTLRTADKHQVVVRTFHLTDTTEFYTEKAMQAHAVDRMYFEKHQQGCWVVRYCAHCRVAYKLIRMEV